MAKPDKYIVDPEQQRWYKTYPEFPGVPTCLKLLNQSNVKGAWIDQICSELISNASQTADELITSFYAAYTAQDIWLQKILLYAMAEARLPVFQTVFAAQLHSDNEELRKSAVAGLEQLDTREARTILWEFTNNTAKSRQ